MNHIHNMPWQFLVICTLLCVGGILASGGFIFLRLFVHDPLFGRAEEFGFAAFMALPFVALILLLSYIWGF